MAMTDPPHFRPTWRDLACMGAAAVLLRILLFVAVATLTHRTFSDYAASSDGVHYMAVARAWLGDGAELQAHPYYARLFPGYPALMALLHLAGVPWSAATLLPSWLAVGLVAPLTAVYFRDRRMGWAMAVLTPSFLLNASLVSTEAFCVLLALVGLLLVRSGMPVGAGLVIGLGALFRPVIVFALLGLVVMELVPRRKGSAAKVILASGLVVAAGLLAVYWRFGDPLMSFHHYAGDQEAYAGDLITWPFKALLTTPLHDKVPKWKIGFVGAHAVIVLLGCGLAVRQWVRVRSTVTEATGSNSPGDAPTDRDVAGLVALAAVWLCGNTFYVLCIGSHFGFDEFPRFIIPALPPLFWVYRRFLPDRWWLWLGIAAASFALAVVQIGRAHV
jgi:hypothetical protein